MLPDQYVWVFNGVGGCFPSGVFTDLEIAKQWIFRNALTGVLTAYPLNQGSLDWAMANDCTNISPAKLSSKVADPGFVGSYSSASQEHLHFELGLPSA